MEQEKILLQIETELVALRSFIRKLKPDAKIHQLDIDLLKQKARTMYDSVLMLEPTPDAKPKATVFDIKKPEPATVPEQEIDNSMELEKERLVKNMPAVKAETIMTSEEEISPVEDEPEPSVTEKTPKPDNKLQPIAKEKSDSTVEPEPPKPVEEEKTETIEFEIGQPNDKPAEEKPPVAVSEPEIPEQPAPKKTNPTQADLFSASSETIADKLSADKHKTVADKLSADKLSHEKQNNLRTFIGINEKFLLINELFNGDLSRYNSALDELDSMQTLEGANTCLFEMQVQNQWAEESDAYLKMKELLEKKFA
jgi:hypothetical protein